MGMQWRSRSLTLRWWWAPPPPPRGGATSDLHKEIPALLITHPRPGDSWNPLPPPKASQKDKARTNSFHSAHLS